tara:strand:+ start:260 stop:1030 length:771 start_codon:yes stop_codon:yes gene_type:complete
MHKRSFIEEVFWVLDKRMFRWDHLPSLAQISFVQKSYLLLILIPFLDQFLSPILTLPAGARVELNIGWIYVLPEGVKVSFELGMPFSWTLIYFLVLFLGLGSAMFEIFAPRVIGQANTRKITHQLVLQNFREVANGIRSAKRANHIIYSFVANYTTNHADLVNISPEIIAKASDVGEILVPVQSRESDIRVNKYSVYYIAQHMKVPDSFLDDAFEMLMWFLNETRLIPRWICGTCFVVSIVLFTTLVLQGLYRIIA